MSLRRLVIEMSRNDLFPREAKGFQDVESFRVVHLMRQAPDGHAGVCNVKLRNGARLESLVGVAGFTKVQLLSEEKDGSLTVFIEGRPRPEWYRPRQDRDGYHFPPFELDGDKWRMTFLGSEGQLKSTLARLDKRGLRYRVVHSDDAKFSPASLLSNMTRKQADAIMAAYDKGYYDFPRRIKSRELAKSLGITQATLAQHLRKAERKLLKEIATQNPRPPQ